ncbi:hypothetical protein HBI84_250520 [Parastagonospora nodorum]|nr:hypothetical protein HBI84_250520 [Parastagonospora nodorum]
MTTEKKTLRVRIAGRTVRVGDNRLRGRPMGTSSQRSPLLAPSSDATLDTAPLHEGTLPPDGSAQSSDESTTAAPGASNERSNVELPILSMKVLCEIKACLTVARSVLVDGSAVEMQSSTAFAADVLKDVLDVMKEYEHEDCHKHGV